MGLDIRNISINKLNDMLSTERDIIELIAAMKTDSRSGVQKLLEKYYREQDSIRREKEKSERLLTDERKLWAGGYTYLGGVDEVGRGPLAGPVVAACAILPKGLIIHGVDDSKKLTPAKRDELYDIIVKEAVSYGVGIVSHTRIDEINIYQATKEAMLEAVSKCSRVPEYLLIDAMHLEKTSIPQLSIIGGDAKSQSIAAASIIAKVTRDRLMEDMSRKYPGYGFEKHKGYPTEEHYTAIRKLGLSPIHRKSFTGNIDL